MPHGAAHDAAKHIAAALVGRQHAVGDEERRGTQMIGNDTMRKPFLTFGADAGCDARCLDQSAQQIDVEYIVLALENRSAALKSHAGIDRGPRQRYALARHRLVEWHENKLVELKIAIAIPIRAAGRAAGDLRPLVIENLRAIAAWAGVAHLPEVLLKRHNPRVEQSCDLAPKLASDIVGRMDRCP